jgi:hypothetical protein
MLYYTIKTKLTAVGSLIFYDKKDLNNSTNPIAIAYSMLKKMGYEDGSTEGTIDLANFLAASALRDSWKFSYVASQSLSYTSALSSIAKEAGLIVYEDSEGQFKILDLLPPAEVSLEVTDADLTLRNTVLEYGEVLDSLGYLVSELTLLYEGGTVEPADLPQAPFEEAQKYLVGRKRANKITLKHVSDRNTAIRIGNLNMNYHKNPARFLTTLYHGVDLKAGDWCLITSNVLPRTEGNLYLVIQVQGAGFLKRATFYQLTVTQGGDIVQRTANVDQVIQANSNVDRIVQGD